MDAFFNTILLEQVVYAVPPPIKFLFEFLEKVATESLGKQGPTGTLVRLFRTSGFEILANLPAQRAKILNLAAHHELPNIWRGAPRRVFKSRALYIYKPTYC